MGSLDLWQIFTALFSIANLAFLLDTRKRNNNARQELKDSAEAEFKEIVKLHETEVKTWRLQHEKDHAKFEATYANDQLKTEKEQRALRHETDTKLQAHYLQYENRIVRVEDDVKDIIKHAAGMK